MNLGRVGEDGFLAQLLPQLVQARDVFTGPGDDCAVVRSPGGRDFLVLKTDCVVENVHFTRASSPSAVGWKALARPLSDFAAMSARPRYALITLIAPARTEIRWLHALYRGMEKAARRFEVSIVGGETSSTRGPLAISVALSGSVEKNRLVTRAGGRPGDEVFVTGKLGGSRRGRHLHFIPRIDEARWLTKHFALHAMIDLSDGLGADLPRLAAASGCGFDLDETAIPRNRGCSLGQAISDGEDYELLFALAPRSRARLLKTWRTAFPAIPLTRIGRLEAKGGNQTRKWSGYVHFQKRG